MSAQGPEQGIAERGFQFAGEPVAADGTLLEPGALFDVADQARLYTKVHSDLGMIADPDKAAEEIEASMQALHDALVEDRLPEDADVIPFFAIDLPEQEGAFAKAEAAFNGQLPGIPEMAVYRPLYDQLSPAQLNRRSFAGEAAVKGWSARAMILGGEREDAPGLLFTDHERKGTMNAKAQIKAFKKLRTEYDGAHPNSALALLNTMDHLVINAAIREENESGTAKSPLLDPNTFSRTPQAGDPKTGLVKASDGDSWVPFVVSGGGQVGADGSVGRARPDEGLRVSAGPKQA